jgi:hypothetical protein
MRLVKYIAIAIVNAFGVVIGIIWVAVPATLAQPSLNYQLQISQRQPEGETPQSLSELYKLRDRLKLELDQLAKTPDTPFFSRALETTHPAPEITNSPTAARKCDNSHSNRRKS